MPREIKETIKRGPHDTVPFVISHHTHHGIVPYARIIHQHGYIVVGMSLFPFADSLYGLLLIANVEGQQFSSTTGRFYERFHLGGGRSIGTIVKEYRQTGFRQPQTNCLTYATGASGN